MLLEAVMREGLAYREICRKFFKEILTKGDGIHGYSH
jgi:hypothetical protein